MLGAAPELMATGVTPVSGAASRMRPMSSVVFGQSPAWYVGCAFESTTACLTMFDGGVSVTSSDGPPPSSLVLTWTDEMELDALAS